MLARQARCAFTIEGMHTSVGETAMFQRVHIMLMKRVIAEGDAGGFEWSPMSCDDEDDFQALVARESSCQLLD